MRIAVPGRWVLVTDGTVEAPLDPEVLRVRQPDGSLVIYRVKPEAVVALNRFLATSPALRLARAL